MNLQKVTAALVTEVGPFRFVAEASTLGFPVGQTPNSLETDLGNGQRLLYTGMDRDGTTTFKQIAGCIELRVFND